MKLPKDVKITPMLRQYIKWKEKYPDCLLFFRMGDFYEMFFDDARIASDILDIALTSRDPKKSLPMAGVPFHSVDGYLGKLVRAGWKVAICEQIGEPDGKTLVERRVIRIVTPGTYVPENSDEEGRLAAIFRSGKEYALALLSPGTGAFEAGVMSETEAIAMLTAFHPLEVLAPGEMGIKKHFVDLQDLSIVECSREDFDVYSGRAWLCAHWDIKSLRGFGIEDESPAIGAAVAVLRYLEDTQFGAIDHISSIKPILSKGYLHLDITSQRNLELLDDKGPSLYNALNRCKSPMGKRLFKEWIVRPLLDLDAIGERQDGVERLTLNGTESLRIGKVLCQCRDVKRSVARLSLRMGNPRDLSAIRDTLLVLPELREACNECGMNKWIEGVPDLSALSSLLSKALSDNPPRNLQSGGIIRGEFDADLDEWRDMASSGQKWIEKYTENERIRTGLPRLKVGFNKVFGYYIEISKSNMGAEIPEDYVRRQTLVSAERFITQELKQFETKMLASADEIRRREEELYVQLVQQTLEHARDLQLLGDALARVDVLHSMAEIASEMGYVRPVVGSGRELDIKGARHPVLEAFSGGEPFVPNDIHLGGDVERIAIITGPNMAGKSTYLRMTAVLVIMAQMGSFIPADSASMGLCDRVFTRIGARDELARGNSTFMVEMVETANILRNVTDRSLVILDEIGRGTSTYDGMSIAWAVVEYLHDYCGATPKVFFATHYHELTILEEKLESVKNLSMSVRETDKGVAFLHEVVEGPADRSYGVEVARLAGIPQAVVTRSSELLEKFESRGKENDKLLTDEGQASKRQLKLFSVENDAILDRVNALNPDEMTPMQALEVLYQLKDQCKEVVSKR